MLSEIALLLLLCAVPTQGFMYDASEAFAGYAAHEGYTCLEWTKALSADQLRTLFADSEKKPAELGAKCAIPARSVGECKSAIDCPGSYFGPVCPADVKGKTQLVTCVPQGSVPEQINLQVATDSTVVVGFVTFEATMPQEPPQAMLGPADQGEPSTNVTGVTHWFETFHVGQEQRNYSMHFVRFGELKPRAKMVYKVRSGAPGAPWSPVFTFRAPYGPSAVTAEQPTRVNIYGDMGNTFGNNMANLLADCTAGAADLIVHMGDHCYNMGDANGEHGDAYMNAFQDVLANCPWLPIIGNHESTLGPGSDKVDASTESRYLNQTWGVVGGLGGPQHSAVGVPLRVNADTPLGALMTSHTVYAAGGHGANPSRTSQWTSIDIGLIHIVTLDLNPGPPPVFSGEQLAWFEQDMAAAVANRKQVPWIVVTSHFPLLGDRLEEEPQASAAWYTGEEAEAERNGSAWRDLDSFERCDPADTTCVTIGDAFAPTTDALSALLDKYQVDIYIAGHVHSYSASWPIFAGKADKSFSNPRGTVHITEGNGGVPVTSGAPPSALVKCKSALWRMCGTGMNYGRLTAANHTVLTYDHVENPTGNVTDSFSIVRSDRRAQV